MLCEFLIIPGARDACSLGGEGRTHRRRRWVHCSLQIKERRWVHRVRAQTPMFVVQGLSCILKVLNTQIKSISQPVGCSHG